MSSKITQAQLNANKATVYALDDYRKMVNYVSGTNKGYVRFSLGQDGKLKLEKFNNKVDVPLSWRSNTKAEHNCAVREKFADALERDLKYANENTRLRIVGKVLSPTDGANRIQTGKALSRRDIKAALEEYDKVFNTPGGRRNLLHNFFRAAMAECGFKGDLETFKRDFMKLDAYGLDFTVLDKYCADVEGEGPERERMVKSEVEFRTLITHLEGLLDATKMRIGVDTNIKSLARAALEKGDAFGLDVANQNGGKLLSDIRASLTGLLALKGVKNVEAHIETFLQKVLPFYIQDGIANVRDYAGGDKAKQDEAIEANFDFEALVDLAAEFVKEAAEAEKNPGGPKPLDEKDYGVLHQLAVNVAAAKENNEITILVWNATAKNAAVSPDKARELGQRIVSMKELFRRDAAVDNCAARFVIKHFARGAENMLQQDATAVDKVKEYLQQKLVPALQLQYGERWADGKGGYTQNRGVSHFVNQLTDHMQTVVDTVGGGRELYEKLFSHTLPDIINNRIDNAVKGKDRMHFEGGENSGLDYAAKQINRVGMAWRDFRNVKAPVLAEKAIAGFSKILVRQQKKGNIDENQHASLLGDFRARMQSAVERAIDRYFNSPAPEVKSDDLNKDVKDEVQRFMQFFNEEKSAVISEMSHRLDTAIISHSIKGGADGVKAKRDVMDASKPVGEFLSKLSGREKPLDRQLADGPALRRGLERLYFKTLNEMLQARNVDKKPVDSKFVDDVRAAFEKKAADHVANAEKFAKKLDEAVRKKVSGIVNDLIDNPNSSLHDYAKLGKNERKELVDALTGDTMLAKHGHIGTLKARFVENPDVYGKADAETIVENEFADDNSTNSPWRVALRAGKERIMSAAAWIDAKDEQGNTFETKLLASEELRLQQANPEVSPKEIANIAKERTDAMMKRVVDVPILYTIGGREGFDARVGKELADASDARMKAYTAFRSQFMKLAQASLDKCSSLGKEKLATQLKMVLDDASKKNPPPDAKITALAFDKMLTDMVNGIIDKKFDEYLAYSKQYTEAFENADPVMTKRIETRAAELKEAGATDEDVAFFRETIAPLLRDRMEFQIAAKPEEWLGKAGKDKAAKLFDDTFNAIKRDVDAVKLDPSDDKQFEEALRYTLGMIDLEQFMDDPTTCAAVKDNVKTWLKGDDVKGLFKDMRRAMMTLRVYDRGSQAAPAKAALKAVDEFYASLRAAVTGIQSQILMKDFNNTQLEPALKLFELWLEKYDLPKTKFKSGTGGETTLKERAMEHFTQRVKDLQQRIVDNGKVTEPLLSQEYLKSFLQFINEHGTALMILEMKDAVKAGETQRIAESGFGPVFDADAAKKNGDPENIVTAKAVNLSALNKLFDMNMAIVEKEMRNETPSLESLQRWRKNIEERFATHMRNTNAFKASCDTRVKQIQQLGELVPKAMKFLEDAMLERFGGESITTSTKLSEKTIPQVAKFVAVMTNNFMTQMMDKVNSLERTALKTVSNPLKGQNIFTTDTSSESALSNVFRKLAHDCVDGACQTSAYHGLVKQIDKELGIKHK